jgi:aspartyl-tRNA(Asn)/glutamyl-tRNA(Gln) amidotransferase subunit C
MLPVISPSEVAHVARLARLDLTETEVEQFAAQLAGVLEHAAAVAALDTSGVVPTSHPLGLLNVTREDVPRPGLSRDEVLAQAPAAEAGQFRVPRILA